MQSFRLCVFFVLIATFAMGTSITPDFDGAPTGWTTDRYQPNAFQDIGTFQGRDNVLGISISESDGFGSRPSGYNSTFYNTQGKKYTFDPLSNTGLGSVITADLWLPSEWRLESNGSRRTDMWATMEDGGSVITAYPIIGFSNYGTNGVGAFRVWDGDVGWITLADTVNYDAWNTLAIKLAASGFEFYVNGNLAHTDTTTGGTTRFRDMMLQAYNFNGDPSLAGAITSDGKGNYRALWSNTPDRGGEVPEPATYLLTSFVLLGLAVAKRKHKRL